MPSDQTSTSWHIRNNADTQQAILDLINANPPASSTKRYVATLSCDGATDPVVDSVQINTLGVTITTNIVSPGTYQLIASSPVFTEGKTWPVGSSSNPWEINSFLGTTIILIARLSWIDESTIGIEVADMDVSDPAISPVPSATGFALQVSIEVFP